MRHVRIDQRALGQHLFHGCTDRCNPLTRRIGFGVKRGLCIGHLFRHPVAGDIVPLDQIAQIRQEYRCVPHNWQVRHMVIGQRMGININPDHRRVIPQMITPYIGFRQFRADAQHQIGLGQFRSTIATGQTGAVIQRIIRRDDTAPRICAHGGCPRQPHQLARGLEPLCRATAKDEQRPPCPQQPFRRRCHILGAGNGFGGGDGLIRCRIGRAAQHVNRHLNVFRTGAGGGKFGKGLVNQPISGRRIRRCNGPVTHRGRRPLLIAHFMQAAPPDMPVLGFQTG